MIIDTHIHLIGATPVLQDVGDKVRTVPDGVAFVTRYPDINRQSMTQDPIDISDELFKDFDRHGIARGLIQQRPGRGTNDMVWEAAKEHSDKLHGMIATRGLNADLQGRSRWDLPTDGELHRSSVLAAEEIERCVEMGSFVGLAETGPRAFSLETHPEKMARDMRPWLDVAAKYRLPLQFATGWTQFPGGMLYADPVWTDEIAGRYPEIPVILTKMGRGLHHFDTALAIAMRNMNVYFDTVGTIGEHIRIAVDTIGADRIMFGSDWSPTWRWLSDPTDVYSMRKKTLDDAKLTPQEREQIEWRTAATVFGLDVS